MKVLTQTQQELEDYLNSVGGFDSIEIQKSPFGEHLTLWNDWALILDVQLPASAVEDEEGNVWFVCHKYLPNFLRVYGNHS